MTIDTHCRQVRRGCPFRGQDELRNPVLFRHARDRPKVEVWASTASTAAADDVGVGLFGDPRGWSLQA
jgi:hypothetical protein